MHAVDVKIKARNAVAGATGLVVDRMDTVPAFVIFVAAFVAFCLMAIWVGAPKAG